VHQRRNNERTSAASLLASHRSVAAQCCSFHRREVTRARLKPGTMLYARLIASFLALVVCIAACEGGSITKRRAPSLFDAEIADKEMLEGDIELFNKMVLRIIDTLIEDAQERGVTSNVIGDMMRKRGGIRKCFFHAVNCW